VSFSHLNPVSIGVLTFVPIKTHLPANMSTYQIPDGHFGPVAMGSDNNTGKSRALQTPYSTCSL
jgi:hypothetical protein